MIRLETDRLLLRPFRDADIDAYAALTHAFEHLHWPRAISLIDPENRRSIQLAERLGEQPEGEATVRGHRVRVYAVTRGSRAAE